MHELMLIPVYQARIVLLSIGIAFLGSYICTCLCEQYRLSLAGRYRPKVLGKHGFLWCMAIALGGIVIWCMHFMGMSALKLKLPTGEEAVIRYYVFPVVLSFCSSVLLAYAGLYYASHDILFGKTKTEIIELYKAMNVSSPTVRNRRTTNLKILAILTTQSPRHLLIGGVIFGLGVSIAHFVGMWGMRFNDGYVEWNAGCMVGSIVLAIVAATAAFWILFRLLSVYPHLEYLRVLSALVMAGAVTGMHFTGTVTSSFEYQVGRPSHSSAEFEGMEATISGYAAFYGCMMAAVLLGTALMMLSFAEMRAALFQKDTDLKSHENFVAFLQSDERYAAYVKKWFPTFSRQQSLTSMFEAHTLTEKASPAWSLRAHRGASPFASLRSLTPSSFSTSKVVPTLSGGGDSTLTVELGRHHHNHLPNGVVTLFENGGSMDDGDRVSPIDDLV